MEGRQGSHFEKEEITVDKSGSKLGNLYWEEDLSSYYQRKLFALNYRTELSGVLEVYTAKQYLADDNFRIKYIPFYQTFIALKYAISWGLTQYNGTRIRLCRFRQGEPGKNNQRVNSVMCTTSYSSQLL